MSMIRTLRRTLPRLLGCMLTGALCMLAFTLWQQGYVGVSDLPAAVNSPLWLADALLLTLLFWLGTGKSAARISIGMVLLGLLFGVVNAFATTLFAYDSWAFLDSATAWAWMGLRIVGQSLSMAVGLSLVCGWLEQAGPARVAQPTAVDLPTGQDPDAQPMAATPMQTLTAAVMRQMRRLLRRTHTKFPRLAAFAHKHPLLSAMAFLLLCWSPYLLIFYPGTVIWDLGEMVGQFFGVREMTTWHPVFTTWVIGTCVWLGRLVGSDNLGAFAFTLLQTFALAYALADAVRLMRRFGLGRAWWIGALLFFGLTPIFGSFAQAIGKDTLYTAALLVFAVRIAEGLRFGGLSRRGLIVCAIAALASCLVRSNGLYVVIGTTVPVLLFGFRGKARLQVGSALLSAVTAALLFANVLIPALGIKDETASGLYSVCFQQSARVLRDCAQTVTPEEYAALDTVLAAADLPALYQPVISDPVKFTFRQYGQGHTVEAAALKQYRKVWLSMFAKYPLPYLQAFIAGNSGYYSFTPKIDAARTFNNQGGIRFVFETYSLGDDPRYLHTVQIPALEKARVLLSAYSRGWRRVPGLALCLLCAVYTWALVGAGLSLARQKRWRLLLAYLPAVLSVGVCLLSPVNDYFRYFLPVVAMTPMLLGLAKQG